MIDPRAQMLHSMMADAASKNPEFQQHLEVQGVKLGDPMEQGDSWSEPSFRKQPNAHDAEVDKIKQLMDQLEASQAEDRRKASSDRMSELALRAGQAVSSQMGGLPITEKGPLTERPSRAGQMQQKIDLQDKLQNSLFKRENPEDERLMKWLIANDKNKSNEGIAAGNNKTKENVAGEQIEAKKQEAETQREFKKSERIAHEGFNADQGDKNRAAGLTRPVVAAAASSGQQGQRQDAQFANEQAERQLVGRSDITPHTATDKSIQSVTDGALRSVEKVGSQAVEIMRKYGRNFPQSTEWQKLESTMMDLNQEVNHLHHNGVMNFNDKDNNKQEIGDAQSLKQYMLNNGPDVLEHAIKNLHTNVDQQAMSHGYGPLDDKNWKPKGAKDYLQHSSGGGGSRSGPLQDPNKLKDIINSVNKGTPMPELRDAQGQVNHDPVDIGERRGMAPGKMAKYVPGKGMVKE